MPIKTKVKKTRVSSRLVPLQCLKLILAFFERLEDFPGKIPVEQLMSKLTRSHVGPGGKQSHQCPCVFVLSINMSFVQVKSLWNY